MYLCMYGFLSINDLYRQQSVLLLLALDEKR